jgi:hypothetical protein
MSIAPRVRSNPYVCKLNRQHRTASKIRVIPMSGTVGAPELRSVVEVILET